MTFSLRCSSRYNIIGLGTLYMRTNAAVNAYYSRETRLTTIYFKLFNFYDYQARRQSPKQLYTNKSPESEDKYLDMIFDTNRNFHNSVSHSTNITTITQTKQDYEHNTTYYIRR